MVVGDVMTRLVEFVDADATVCEAASLMGELDVGALPIGGPDELAGVVTDRDILFRVVAKGFDPTAVTVGEVASRPVVGCAPDDGVQAAMDLMASHGCRRLVVRDAGGVVVGWITLADLARQLLVTDEAIQRALATMRDGA
jgi:CBS domain-containing protein